MATNTSFENEREETHREIHFPLSAVSVCLSLSLSLYSSVQEVDGPLGNSVLHFSVRLDGDYCSHL